MSSGIGYKAIEKLKIEIERQEKELTDLNNLLVDKQGDIDELDDLIKGIDKKVLGNIDGINTLYQEVADAYENQISIGCSSGLIWVDAGISTSGAGTSVRTWVCTPLPQTCFNRYGLQCLKKPCNRQYNINVVEETAGTVSVGSTIFIVNTSNYTVDYPNETNPNALNFFELTDIDTGDLITDDTQNPTLFTEGALPTVVGFASTTNAFSTGIKTSFVGDVTTGTKIIAIRDKTVAQLGLQVGDYIYSEGVTGTEPSKEYSTNTIVGFGTTTIVFDSYYADTGIGTTVAVAEAITLSTAVVGSATTNTFLVGVGTVVPAIIMSAGPVGTGTNFDFTFIRNTTLYEDFNIDRNPLEKTTVGVIVYPKLGGFQPVGAGLSVILINNGFDSAVQKYNSLKDDKQFKDQREEKPNVGNGQVCYRIGNKQWPVLPFTGDYAVLGDILTLDPVLVPPYTSTPPGSGCGSAQTTIDNALDDLGGANFSEFIDNSEFYIDASNEIRYSRHRLQLEAWAILQAISELEKRRKNLIKSINRIKDPNFDVLD